MPIARPRNVISLDTETTGVDFAHGAKPFLVTSFDHRQAPDSCQFWEWPVDPLTRQPAILQGDCAEIQQRIESADLIYLQNSKFDARALSTIGIELPWSKVRDTLVAGHLLASNWKHGLDKMVGQYLGEDYEFKMEELENAIKKVTQAARLIVKKDYPDWKIAREGDDSMPSIKGGSKRDEDKPWKNDMWLPRALIAAGCKNYIPQHWATACREYANGDSEYTLYLGVQMEQLVRQRGYWPHYMHRLELMRAACDMEEYGVTVVGGFTDATIDEYERYVAEAGAELQSIAAEVGHELELADGASLNDNMRQLFYGGENLYCTECKYRKCVKHWNGEYVAPGAICPKCIARKRRPMRVTLIRKMTDGFNLPIIESKKSGNATLDKDAVVEYLTTLDQGPALDFIKLLQSKRKHDTDLSYMHAYRRFSVPIYVDGCVGTGYETGYYRIHPGLNPFGTDHLRWSSSNPNLQNVGKQEDECDDCEGRGGDCEFCNGTGKLRISVRNCFGPTPDREWWSMDFQNVELRIPAYESGEQAMIEVFEKPDEPPYWGSYHNLIASIVYKDEYYDSDLHLKRDGFKKKYKWNLYQWIKNFNFAKQYGCGRAKGDATAHKVGAFDMVSKHLPALAALQAYYLREAERTGWVQTLPTRAIDVKKGYPLLASRTDDNRVLSTTPFNYHVSGTACEAKNLALLRCAAQCKQWREQGFDARIPLEIHDEILFDFPKGENPQDNKPRALVLKALMEQSGEDMIPRVPTPVNVEYHSRTWAEGVAV